MRPRGYGPRELTSALPRYIIKVGRGFCKPLPYTLLSSLSCTTRVQYGVS